MRQLFSLFFSSFRNRLIAMLLLVSMTAVLVEGTAFILIRWHDIQTDLEHSGQDHVQLVSESIVAAVADEDARFASQILASMKAESAIVSARAYLADGRLLASYQSDRQTENKDLALNDMQFSSPVLLDGTNLGRVEISVTTQGIVEEIRHDILLVAGIMLLTALIAVVLAVTAQRGLTSRIAGLAEVMRRVEQNADYDPVAPIEGVDELNDLAVGLNAMLERVREQENLLEQQVSERTADLEAQLEISRQLANSLEMIMRAIEQTGEAVMICSMDGKLEYKNPAFGKMTGVGDEIDAMEGCPICNAGFFPESERQRMDERLRSGKMWAGQVEAVRPDGSVYPALLSLIPMGGEQGGIDKIVLIARDLSEQRVLEEQLHQAQKMESIGVLVGGIAHDFNNMLAGIVGSIELAKLDSRDPQKVARWLDDIESISLRAGETIAKLLAFARKNRVEMSPVEMRGMIRSAGEILRIGIHESIDLTLQLPDQDVYVHGDINQLEQMLMNLANNAVDAVDDNDRPNVEIRLEVLDHHEVLRHPKLESGSYCCLSVQDNGVGIRPYDLERIYEPFYTTKDVGKGTGLGLSMAYGTVQRHSGVLDVESRPGRGTVFRIYFPTISVKSEASMGEPPRELHMDSAWQGKLALLADDEAVVLQMGRRLLERLGFEVLLAADGREALDLFNEYRDQINLVVLDVVMPVMGGPVAARRIRESGSDVPILFVTGYDPDTHCQVNDTLMDEMNVLAKPYRLQDFADRIFQLLS